MCPVQTGYKFHLLWLLYWIHCLSPSLTIILSFCDYFMKSWDKQMVGIVLGPKKFLIRLYVLYFLIIIIFKKILLICLFVWEEDQSLDLKIRHWTKVKSWTLNRLTHPHAPLFILDLLWAIEIWKNKSQILWYRWSNSTTSYLTSAEYCHHRQVSSPHRISSSHALFKALSKSFCYPELSLVVFFFFFLVLKVKLHQRLTTCWFVCPW